MRCGIELPDNNKTVLGEKIFAKSYLRLVRNVSACILRIWVLGY